MQDLQEILRELAELRTRTGQLEDVEAIRKLQLQYWRAVDGKNPELLRSLFAPGDIHIAFEGMQTWTSRDAFVRTFVELGMDPARQENHFGLNPIIELTGTDTASATWRLLMFAYNVESRTVIRITGAYDAAYVRRDGQWFINTLVFRRHSIHCEQIREDGQVEVPDFGQVSLEAASHLFGHDDNDPADTRQ